MSAFTVNDVLESAFNMRKSKNWLWCCMRCSQAFILQAYSLNNVVKLSGNLYDINYTDSA
ncbi:hypothetical protein NIES4071_05930 [Calothrix sp. NIES-4071]|nr:hypothetical protein NIES4071_05930 [Calothrix sp. NIES-4071]BAZ54936.1 hypothetical protein NIES4105_05900 [Calothrix sp. NIES-4105]